MTGLYVHSKTGNKYRAAFRAGGRLMKTPREEAHECYEMTAGRGGCILGAENVHTFGCDRVTALVVRSRAIGFARAHGTGQTPGSHSFDQALIDLGLSREQYDKACGALK